MNIDDIESRRQQLIKMVNKYGLNSTKVILYSRELDKLIAQYQIEQVLLPPSTHPKKIS